MHDQLHPPSGKNFVSLRYAGSLNRHQLYMAIVVNACACTQGLFWLPRRIGFVGRGNQFEDIRFLFSPFLPMPCCGRQNANTTLPLQLPMKFSNIVRAEASRYLTKITILQKADLKSARSKVLAAKHTVSLQLLCTVGGDLASRVP